MDELIYKVNDVLEDIYSELNNSEEINSYFKDIKHELIDYCRENDIIKNENKEENIKKQIINNESKNSLINFSKINQVVEENKSKTQNVKDIKIIFDLIDKIIEKETE